MNELQNFDPESHQSDFFKLQFQSESNRNNLRQDKLELDHDFKHYVLLIFFASLGVIFLYKYFTDVELIRFEKEKLILINKKTECKR